MILRRSSGKILAADVFRRHQRRGTTLGAGVLSYLAAGLKTLIANGATRLTGGLLGGGPDFCCQNTLLRVTRTQFVSASAWLVEF